MNIKLLRLISGEEILADLLEGRELTSRVTHVDSDAFYIDNPLQLLMNNEGGVGAAVWLPYVDKSNPIPISRNYVGMVLEPDQSFKDEYRKFASPISLPNTKIQRSNNNVTDFRNK